MRPDDDVGGREERLERVESAVIVGVDDDTLLRRVQEVEERSVVL
jgi:hypothetical protein